MGAMSNPLTLEVTIRMSVDRDLYDGKDDGGICHLARMDTNEIRNRPWDSVTVRVAEKKELPSETR